MTLRTTLANIILLLTLALAAPADAFPVTYKIGPYSTGGYSASWLHTASGCPGTGPDTGDTLYMCGYATPVTGLLTGTLDAGVFSIDGGYLNIFGHNFNVGLSSLGGDFTNAAGDLLWFLNVDSFGTFSFESIAMGTGGPNHFGPDHFVLWGQNDDAYDCASLPYDSDAKKGCLPWGVDLYGERVSVPEPGTLALLGIGLLGIALATRRRPLAART